MASDGVKEGVRRLAKVIEILAWLWLVLCLSLGALSAWGQQAPPTYDANFQQVPNTTPPINSPKITSVPAGTAAPTSVQSSVYPQIDPSKVQWDPEPKRESAAAPPAPKDYVAAVLLALAGVAGFAILRALAWILAGFAK